MNGLPPPDEAAHIDGLFMHEVTVVNNLLARYAIRFLDADAGRATPMPVSEERALAARVAEVAAAMDARAALREERSKAVVAGDRHIDSPS
jgi:hypothetical protein